MQRIDQSRHLDRHSSRLDGGKPDCDRSCDGAGGKSVPTLATTTAELGIHLVVTIETDDVSTDLYTPIANQISIADPNLTC